jgi:hypothetical protein
MPVGGVAAECSIFRFDGPTPPHTLTRAAAMPPITLYYAPGASSGASHATLRAAGLDFRLVKVRGSAGGMTRSWLYMSQE